ncbi:hypothetical protein D3C85_1517910 [compost metagenome]
MTPPMEAAELVTPVIVTLSPRTKESSLYVPAVKMKVLVPVPTPIEDVLMVVALTRSIVEALV